MKTTRRIPKGIKPRSDQIRALTEGINALLVHFTASSERSHDSKSRKKLERLVHRRGTALTELKDASPELHAKLKQEITKGGAA